MSVDHQRRQHRLAHHYLTDVQPDSQLQQTVALAASTLDFPRGQVNILDATRQHTITDTDGDSVHVLPRRETVCTLTVLGDGVLAVDDLRADPRFNDLPGVRAGIAVSYLGVPLRSRESAVIGTLCVFDTVPRVITSAQIAQIKQFGSIVEDRLDLMRRADEHNLAGQTAAQSLARAIERDEIVAWFQPIVDLRSDQVVGYEALARWEHPNGTIDTPGAFIRLAEDSDLIVDLDRAVMRRALPEFARRQRRHPELRLGINVSTRHLQIPDGVSFIRQAVREAGVAPTSVTLELTETRELADMDRARSAVAQLRDYGFDVVLDDFGSGWSSLDWVLGLPIGGIKIDRAVTAALGSPVGDAITLALAGLARDLDLNVVIEGVGTRAQVEAAKALGLRYGQGYYWAPPLPVPRSVDGGAPPVVPRAPIKTIPSLAGRDDSAPDQHD